MNKLFIATLLLSGSTFLSGQTVPRIPETYKPSKSEMYHKGWIDFNKNGVKDVYEDPSAPVEARIENLLGQMTLEEKTCQMVTLYGYNLASLFFQCHLAEQIFDTCIQRGIRIFVYILHSVFVEINPAFLVHLAFDGFVHSGYLHGLLCAEQSTASEQ